LLKDHEQSTQALNPNTNSMVRNDDLYDSLSDPFYLYSLMNHNKQSRLCNFLCFTLLVVCFKSTTSISLSRES